MFLRYEKAPRNQQTDFLKKKKVLSKIYNILKGMFCTKKAPKVIQNSIS